MKSLKEYILEAYPAFRDVVGDKKEAQAFLDAHREGIMSSIGDVAGVGFTKEVYDATAEAYDKDSHTQAAPDTLFTFVDRFKEGDQVLDLGCGHGRDSAYMIGRGLHVVSYDLSLAFLGLTHAKLNFYDHDRHALVLGDFSLPEHGGKIFEGSMPVGRVFFDTFEGGRPHKIFDGIWACTSLLIHTPLERLDSAVGYWAKTLKDDGVFHVSYFNPHREGFFSGPNLRASTTGEVKLFYQPSQEDIDRAFSHAGLVLEKAATLSDYVDSAKGIDRKSFFSDATYVKR